MESLILPWRYFILQ